MEISITWNICRVCLVEEQKKSEIVDGPMRHIFNEDEMLAKQIYECSGVTMKPNDNLPEKICKKCYTLIKYAVNFRDTCRASDTYLQNILQRTKSASALFKEQQPLEPFEEITTNECLKVDNNDDATNETSVKSKRKEGYAEKLSKIHKDMEYSDLIEFENDDSDYTGSSIDEAIAIVKHDGESDDSQIILHLNTTDKQDSQINEDEENQETGEELFKSNSDEAIVESAEKEDDDNVESFEQIEQFIAHKSIQRDVTLEMESESGDSQAKVSSTVAIREDGNDIIELEAADDTQFSSEASDMQTEYIIDEFLIDDNSCDSVSLQNSSMILVPSKKSGSVVNKYESNKIRTKIGSNRRTQSKTRNDLQVWVCDMCGNHFGNRQILNAHIKVHRQEKNHECEICSKRFITACNLQAHMRIHTGEKPFECKYCGRRFSDRSSNLRHERTHTNERPFECKQCGKAFSLGTTLKKHLKVHTGERSFSCDICAKSFKLPHQLKAHKNSTLHKAVEQLTQIEQ